MKNIELKISINNFNKVIPLLKKIKARRINKLYQKDIYYHCKNGRLKIRTINNKKFELIFYKRPDKLDKKISNYQIFNIKPKQVNFIKSMLDKKFGEQVIVEKKRELWIYNHTRIHIDKVLGLGNFLELETVIKNINIKKAEKEFGKVINLLNLKKDKKYSKSYSDLLLRDSKTNQTKLKKFTPFVLAKAI